MNLKKFIKKSIVQFVVIVAAILIVGLWGCEKTRNYNTDQKNNIINNRYEATTEKTSKKNISRNEEANPTLNKPNPSASQPQNQGANQSSNEKNQASENSNNESSDLTPWQVKHGNGPIKKDIKLGPINPNLVSEGKKLFNTT